MSTYLMHKKNWFSPTTIATVTTLTLLLCLLRLSGGLEYFELKIYDLYQRLLPEEEKNPHITIVAINEENIQKNKNVSLDDLTLAQIIQTISKHNPRVIALDLHRDIPIPPGTEELNQTLADTSSLIGVGLLGDPHLIPPHPILAKKKRYAGSGMILDSDSRVRRVFLYPLTVTEPNTPSLGLATAIDYLRHENIIPHPGPSGDMQIAETEYHRFQFNDGGYIRERDGSYQIILPWRNPPTNFKTVDVQDVLDGNYDVKDFEAKAVFIGSTAVSLKDYYLNPFSSEIDPNDPKLVYGVHIHANLTAAILDNVFLGRPLIKIWSDPVEYIWIIFWSLVPVGGGFLFLVERFKFKDINKFFGLVLLGIALLSSTILFASTYLAFLGGWWLPVVPPLIGIWIISIVLTILLYIDSLRQANLTLEEKVESRTRELQNALHQLQATQQELIIREKNNYLALITAGLIHELKNPLFLTQNNLTFVNDQLFEMHSLFLQLFEEPSEKLIEDFFSNYNESLQNLLLCSRQIERAEELLDNLISGKKNSQIATINLNNLVKNNVNLVYKSYRQLPVSVELKYQLAENLPEIECNRVELSQVIINLTQNAMQSILEKATRPNSDYSGKIVVSTKLSDSEQVQFSIFDNGVGVEPEIKAQLFEPFFTTKAAGEGLGLGLSLSQMIIKNHHGSIECQSNQNLDLTEFRVTLPVAQNLSGTT